MGHSESVCPELGIGLTVAGDASYFLSRAMGSASTGMECFFIAA